MEAMLQADEFALIIESKDRSQAGYSAPGSGLFLVDIIYPSDYLLK
jgi:tRNA pseudouridine38-40 synthase